MGIFDSLMKKETPSRFVEGQPLSSKIWAGNNLITDALKANEKDIMTVQLDGEKLKKVEEESRKLNPVLKVYTYNGCLCYLSKDEHRVYELVQIIEKEIELEEIKKSSIQTRKRGLDSVIRSAENQNSDKSDYSNNLEYIDKSTSNFPPTDVENRWAEAKLVEELKAIEEEIQDANALLNEDRKTKSEDSKPRKKRSSLGRTNRVQIRLTDGELVEFQRRVKKSGLAQGEFLRSAALNGKIVIEERNAIDIAILDELALLRAELGRQGGLLKMITKPSAGIRSLRPDEWEELMNAIRELDSMKEKVSKLEVKFSGNSKTSSK